MYTIKNKKFASITLCNGSKFQAGTLNIFNVVKENGVISNLILTFTYIKFRIINFNST